MASSTSPSPRSANGSRQPGPRLATLAAVLLLGAPATLAARSDAQDSPAPGPTAVPLDQIDERTAAEDTLHALDGRSRFEMRFGVSNLNVTHDEWTDYLDVTGGDFSLAFAHWPHENVALELSMGATNIGVDRWWTFKGERVRAEEMYRVMGGARFYLPVEGAVRPHLDLAGGLLSMVEVEDDPWRTSVTTHRARAGLEVGGGLDFFLGRHFVLGVRGATLVRQGYSSELIMGCTLGWAFGGP